MHHHQHEHSHGSTSHVHGLSKNLWIAFILNTSFTVLEFFGGWLTNSMAILSDAVHDLGDTAAIGCALFLEHLASKKQDANFSYGYKRLSPLGGFVTTLILLSGSIVIFFNSIPRIVSPEPVESQGMIFFALIGLLINGIAAWKLKNDTHAINSRAVMLHLIEDVLGWAAVLIGALTIYLFNWHFIDGYLSVAIALFITYNAVKNLKPIAIIFLQGVPSEISINKIKSVLLEIPSIHKIQNLHIWTLDGEEHILTVKLTTDLTNLNDICTLKTEVKHLLHQRRIHHITIELINTNEICDSSDC